MNLTVVIPVRPPEEGKTRLASALSTADRARLTLAMFDHVLRTVLDVVPPADCRVISRSLAVLNAARARGAVALVEAGAGLNAALTQASASVSHGPILSLSSDLPFLAPDDIVAMTAAPRNAVVIAGDTAGDGTNALWMARPALIPYCYGTASLAAHCAAARCAGLEFSVIRRPGLACDIDLPEQLASLPPALW